MADIRHRVGVQAPIEEVYEAVATCRGIARWWTTEVEADDTGTVGVRFGGPRAATIEFAEQAPPERLTWRFLEGPQEWLATAVTFELRQAPNGETVVLFTHRDWAEPVEFLHHCSTRWGYFMLSLKHALEAGAANPWPRDEKASSWA